MAKREWPRRGNRKSLYLDMNTSKAFDFLENKLMDARINTEFSRVLRSAQREVDYWRLGVFDVDALVYDYAESKFKGLFELKAKSTVNYLDGYFLFRESQYLVTKQLSEMLKVPYYWVLWNREANLWYLTDITETKVQIVKSEKLKYDKFARLDKDSFLTLSDEEFRDWLIRRVF